MTEWTPHHIERRLRKTVALSMRLSDTRAVVGAVDEGIGIIGVIGDGADDSVGDDAVVAEAVEAMSWLRWLEPDDADIVLARLEGVPWKSICWRYVISRPTADRRFRYALALIAWRLNGPGLAGRTPSLRCLLGMGRADQFASRSSQPKR